MARSVVTIQNYIEMYFYSLPVHNLARVTIVVNGIAVLIARRGIGPVALDFLTLFFLRIMACFFIIAELTANVPLKVPAQSGFRSHSIFKVPIHLAQ